MKASARLIDSARQLLQDSFVNLNFFFFFSDLHLVPHSDYLQLDSTEAQNKTNRKSQLNRMETFYFFGIIIIIFFGGTLKSFNGALLMLS